jgi:hypothetical protein
MTQTTEIDLAITKGVKREVRERALEILEGGRELLLQKGIWCKGDLVRFKKADHDAEKNEYEVLLEGTPHRVCALGALYIQPGALYRKAKHIKPSRGLIFAEQVMQDSTPLLTDDYGESWQPDVVDVNDATNSKKKDVIAIYDRAIEKVRLSLG